MNRSKNYRANDHGKAILEFVILLPFLILFTLGASELYRTFEYHQFLSVISREAGNAAFRDCTEYDDGADTEACLQSVAATVYNNVVVAGSPIAETRIRLKVFRWRPGAPGTAAKDAGEYLHGSAQSWMNSHFNAVKVSEFNSYDKLATAVPGGRKQTFVTSEVYLHVAPFLPVFSGNFYETTIF